MLIAFQSTCFFHTEGQVTQPDCQHLAAERHRALQTFFYGRVSLGQFHCWGQLNRRFLVETSMKWTQIKVPLLYLAAPSCRCLSQSQSAVFRLSVWLWFTPRNVRKKSSSFFFCNSCEWQMLYLYMFHMIHKLRKSERGDGEEFSSQDGLFEIDLVEKNIAQNGSK